MKPGSGAGMARFACVLCLASACSEQVPTSLDPNRFPPSPVTAEINLTWDEFGSELRTYGGYGSPSDLPGSVLALDYERELDSRSMVRFGAYPVSVSVRDTSGATRPDSSLTYLGGRFVVFFDTLTSRVDGPVEVGLGATTVEWDARTATWWSAVDTVGNRSAWPEPGGGPVELLGVATWDPTTGDSVTFELDSARIAAWADTSDVTRGARLHLITPGARVDVRGTGLRLLTLPSLRPDSTFYLHVLQRDHTFVYDPYPTAPADGMRIGGVPAWRTVLHVDAPRTVDGSPTLCAAVRCPAALDERAVSYAALVVTTREVSPAFRPSDTVTVDARPVLAEEALPKAPLGLSLTGLSGERVAPAAFGEAGSGTVVEVPITTFVQDLLRGSDGRGNPVPATLALLARIEPASLPFASFHGPDSEHPPMLKLVVTMPGDGGGS